MNNTQQSSGMNGLTRKGKQILKRQNIWDLLLRMGLPTVFLKMAPGTSLQ